MIRKLAYYWCLGVVFFPYLACYVATLAYEALDVFIMHMRRWAFPEKYVRLRDE